MRSIDVALLLAALLTVFASVPAAANPPVPNTRSGAATSTASWPMSGHDTTNDRYNPVETTLSPANVSGLARVWSHALGSYVSATPTVAGGAVYLTDFSGALSAFKPGTGTLLWQHQVSDYTGVSGDFARDSPAYANGVLFFGDHPSGAQTPNGAHLVAVNAKTGALMWDTIVETNPAATITGSPAVANGVVYVGVSSDQEDRNSCCNFRGSVVALNASTGRILWKRYTAPAGYTGVAVWSSNPVVDPATGLLYVGTGNNYSVPNGVCTMPQQTGCTKPAANDYVDSLLALHLSNGTAAWALRTLDSDVSSHACSDPTSCGPDFDFGSDPNLFTTTIAGQTRHLVGIGQKSGIYWAVDASTGKLVWDTRVGPGGTLGGVQWGSATDGTRIYVAEANSAHQPYQLISGATISGGSWAALDPATGRILWQTRDPQQSARDVGSVSVANGVVYAGSDAGTGKNMFAMNAATGKILWSFASKGAVVAGPAIVNGTVYWPSGYRMTTCPASLPKCGTTYLLSAFRVPGT